MRQVEPFATTRETDSDPLSSLPDQEGINKDTTTTTTTTATPFTLTTTHRPTRTTPTTTTTSTINNKI
jgi:hypothetical protein